MYHPDFMKYLVAMHDRLRQAEEHRVVREAQKEPKNVRRHRPERFLRHKWPWLDR